MVEISDRVAVLEEKLQGAYIKKIYRSLLHPAKNKELQEDKEIAFVEMNNTKGY